MSRAGKEVLISTMDGMLRGVCLLIHLLYSSGHHVHLRNALFVRSGVQCCSEELEGTEHDGDVQAS